MRPTPKSLRTRPPLGAALSAGLLAALLASFTPSGASAQNVAMADALFKKGLADMQAGQYTTGCPALGESYRIDPQPGTLFTLAECHAKAGNVATAAARYEDYLQFFVTLTPEQQQRQRGREKIAAAKKQELAPDVPTITITLSPGSQPGARVACDDVELKAAAIGVALPLDPGEHKVRAESPGGVVVEKTFTLQKGDAKALELDVSTTKPPPPAAPKPPPPPPAPPPGLGARRVAAIAVGGVGLAGVGVGVAFGVLTKRRLGVIEDHCILTPGKPDACDTAGVTAHKAAITTGWVSTGGFILGGAGLATAAALFFLTPHASKPKKAAAPRIFASITPAPGGAGALLFGDF